MGAAAMEVRTKRSLQVAGVVLSVVAAVAITVVFGYWYVIVRTRDVDKAYLVEHVYGTAGEAATMWRGTYYCGSDDKYHYFLYERALSTPERYRVDRRSVVLKNPSTQGVNWGSRIRASQVLPYEDSK